MLVWILHFPYSNILGGDPEKVKKSERDRFRDDSIVDQIIEIDNKWRKSKFEIDSWGIHQM